MRGIEWHQNSTLTIAAFAESLVLQDRLYFLYFFILFSFIFSQPLQLKGAVSTGETWTRVSCSAQGWAQAAGPARREHRGFGDVPLFLSQISERFQKEWTFFPKLCLLLLLQISPQMSDLGSKFLRPSSFCAEGFCLQTLARCHTKPSNPKEKGGLQRAENVQHEWAGAGTAVVLLELF